MKVLSIQFYSPDQARPPHHVGLHIKDRMAMRAAERERSSRYRNLTAQSDLDLLPDDSVARATGSLAAQSQNGVRAAGSRGSAGDDHDADDAARAGGSGSGAGAGVSEHRRQLLEERAVIERARSGADLPAMLREYERRLADDSERAATPCEEGQVDAHGEPVACPFAHAQPQAKRRLSDDDGSDFAPERRPSNWWSGQKNNVWHFHLNKWRAMIAWLHYQYQIINISFRSLVLHFRYDSQ